MVSPAPPLECESFSNLAREVEPWPRAANLDSAKKAPARALRMDPIALCTVLGGDQLIDPDAATEGMKSLRDYFAPDAIGAVCQDVALLQR